METSQSLLDVLRFVLAVFSFPAYLIAADHLGERNVGMQAETVDSGSSQTPEPRMAESIHSSPSSPTTAKRKSSSTLGRKTLRG
jgi:hypothetical protein